MDDLNLGSCLLWVGWFCFVGLLKLVELRVRAGRVRDQAAGLGVRPVGLLSSSDDSWASSSSSIFSDPIGGIGGGLGGGINPASGLPMAGDSGVDVMGNAFGTDVNHF